MFSAKTASISGHPATAHVGPRIRRYGLRTGLAVLAVAVTLITMSCTSRVDDSPKDDLILDASTVSAKFVIYWESWGTSPISDVPSAYNVVIVAFGGIGADGTASFNTQNLTRDQVGTLTRGGKKVLLSFGGENANFGNVTGNAAAASKFAKTAAAVVQDWGFSGIDLDNEQLNTADDSNNFSIAIENLRTELGSSAVITLTPQATYVIDSVGSIGGGWNTYVPLLNRVGDKIDWVNIMEYNDNSVQGQQPGTTGYLVALYKRWVTAFTTGSVTYNGLSPDKAVMGVLASPSAGQAASYADPSTVNAALKQLLADGKDARGAMVWSSGWDNQNGNKFTNGVAGCVLQNQC